MDRRLFLASAGVFFAPGLALAKDGPLPLRQAARDMALYGLPLIEMAATREKALKGRSANVLNHARGLVTTKTQTVTQPNNDTLYSSGWLDLAQGPVKITLPKMGDRYFSLALMDMWTDNFAVLGTRTVGGEGGEVVLVGPDEALPAPGAIRSPTTWVWALGRTLVNGEADLDAAHAAQDGLKVTGPAPPREPKAYPHRDARWSQVFAGLQALILESPPPATDTHVFRTCAALGITPSGGFDAGKFTPAQGAEIAAGLADALLAAKSGGDSGERRGGWSFPRQDLGDFRQDYTYRAQVALVGLAALPLNEACYLRALAPDGHDELDPTKTWNLHFPKGQTPPVDAFWSLTCYEVTPAGQGFFFDNPINRYAIGNRTPGLTYNPDGSLDIWIAPKDPGPKRRSNWLPAPTSGRPMTLSLRAYLPHPELANGRYVVPSVLPAKT